MPSDAKELYKRANKVKEKLQKMRKEDLAKSGEFSVGNLAFKKLRNEGYIEKLIDIISGAYGRIYSE
jgi:ribosomal protein L17